MPRQPYRMRKAVEKFTRPNRYDPSLQMPMERLECGHVIADRDVLYGNEKSVQVGMVFRAVSGEKPLRRCYQCGREAETSVVGRE
jgi:hypothetical protein